MTAPASSVAPTGGRTGVVDAFDPDVGLGTLRGDDGGRYLFHCVEIADGSRDIALHAAVRFQIVPKLGRWEAARVEVIDAGRNHDPVDHDRAGVPPGGA